MQRSVTLGHTGKQRIGLLGGSFNPCHDGHLHISIEALKSLRLDQVWWLVSLQNPLKSKKDMAPLEKRLAQAETLTQPYSWLYVSALEQELGTCYTYDTVRALRQRCPITQFVWLMGADNLVQVPRWYRWDALFHIIPVAIFDRSPFTYSALTGKAALRFAPYRVKMEDAALLPGSAVPAWSYLHIRTHPASSTAIRNGK